jgi:threonine/homoserine/homoserine lactone efflux protein
MFGAYRGRCAGLSSLLATSSAAFTVVKWLGAGYLFYLGVSMLIASSTRQQTNSVGPIAAASLWVVFRQGFLTNALNPKVALFFLAFLPQFIAPDAPVKWQSMLFLGLLFNVNGTLWNLFLAWFSTTVSSKIQATPLVARWLNRLGGAMFIWFGVKLIRSES